jgi:hypothetical protein
MTVGTDNGGREQAKTLNLPVIDKQEHQSLAKRSVSYKGWVHS